MKYTLQIAFSKPVGNILLRVCEYAKKFGMDKAKHINPLRFDFSGDVIEVTHPEKDCPIEDFAIHAIEIFTGIPLDWRNRWSEKLEDGKDIEEFFERQFSENILEENGVDPELHIVFYVPLFEECIYKHVKYIIDNLPPGHKFIANVIGITYDVAWACDMLDKEADRETCSYNMLQNIIKIAGLTKLQAGKYKTILKHIFLFQNYNLSGWSQKFTDKKLVEVCANLSLAMVEHYDTICRGSWEDYALSEEEIRQSRPIIAINIQSRVIDTYLGIDRIIRELFNGTADDNIVDKEEVDKKKVKDTYKKILTEEVQLTERYKDRFTNGLLNQSDYESLFDEVVAEKFKNIIIANIESANLNVSEQQYLYSLFTSIDEHTDFESDDFNDINWQSEEMMLEQLDENTNLFETFKKLKLCSNDLTETKNKIEELESIVANLQQKLISDYPANGELTKEGIKIGNEVFKPYNRQDVPLDEDYSAPIGQVLPHSVDLRLNFSDIKSQGRQGACSAFCSVSVIEYFLSKIYNKTTDLSEAFVYYNARLVKGETNKDAGASFIDIIQAIKDHGVCLEELCPYNQEVYDEKPSDSAYSEAENRKITEAKNISSSVDDIRSALAQGYPVIISARAFNSYLLNANGVLRTPTEEELKDTENNHAMVICGYIDREGYFIVRNSWGKKFGDNGYCYMPYEYFRTPRAINQAYVVTGLNIKGFKAGHLPTIDTLLDGKDVNAQYSIYQNMILETTHELEANRNHLNDLHQEYLNLFDKIADYSNNESMLDDLNEQQRIVLEEELKDIVLKKQQKKKGFINIFPDHYDKDNKRIKDELEDLNRNTDNEKRKYRIRLAVLNGLKSINKNCVEESIRRQNLSDYYERQKQLIAVQNDADSKDYEYLRRILPVEQVLEHLKASGLASVVSGLGSSMSRIINGEVGLTDTLGDLQKEIIGRISEKLDIHIADHLNDAVYDEFYKMLCHSTVMAQIEGSVPVGYGDETKYFFCNVEDMPKRIAKECDGVMLLPIKDNLRMSFLHMEKYDIDDLTIFHKVNEKLDSIKAEAKISVKNDLQITNYAKLAAHVYGDRLNSILPIGCTILDTLDDPNTGLKAALYDLGNNEAVCAFAGTRNLTDWVENIKQVFGFSAQYDKALEYAKYLQKKYPVLDISFVGHSQGGGEAAYCAINQGARAFTFNPAGLSQITTWKGKSEFTRYNDINAYIFWNDLLNALQDLTPLVKEWTSLPVNLIADGCIHYINDYEPKEISLAYYHGMQGVLDYFGINGQIE